MGLLWLYVFPMLFLPNLGVSRATAFGTLEISDFLIFPYLFLLCRNLPKQKGLLVYRLIPLLIAFAAWTSIGTLSIPIRYPGESSHYVYLGLLKFARLGLYVTAGILTIRKLSKAGMFPRFLWALTGAGVVIAVALILTPGEEESFGAVGAMQGFKTHNAVSVNLSIVACYLAASLVMRLGTPVWRRCALIALGCMALGSCFSSGRSGWLAAAVAMIYLVWRRGFTRKVLVHFRFGPAGFGSHVFPVKNVPRSGAKDALTPVALLAYVRCGCDGAGRRRKAKKLVRRRQAFSSGAAMGRGFLSSRRILCLAVYRQSQLLSSNVSRNGDGRRVAGFTDLFRDVAPGKHPGFTGRAVRDSAQVCAISRVRGWLWRRIFLRRSAGAGAHRCVWSRRRLGLPPLATRAQHALSVGGRTSSARVTI